MPPKRKASEHTHQSPSKRQTSLRANKQTSDDPLLGIQSPECAMTTPKVRRTYGKQPTTNNATNETTGLEAAISHSPISRQDLNTQQTPNNSTPTPSPTKSRGRRRRLDANETPTKRQSKRRKIHQETDDLPDSERQGGAKAKLVVEIPVLPSPRNPSGATNISLPAYPEPSTPHKLTFTATAPQKEVDEPIPQKHTAVYGRSPNKARDFLNGKHLDHDLSSCLNAQKRAILRTLQNPARLFNSGEAVDVNKTAKEQLQGLLNGTVSRAEGNSCLVLGPRASGKSKVVENCLHSLSSPGQPIVIRLSGWIHHTDRLAMREIAYQLSQQTGKFFLQAEETEAGDVLDQDDDNPFLDKPTEPTGSHLVLPPSSHLPALISTIPTLSRPTIVILDAFDLFTLHPRQALLYCLFDTVQSCRASADSKGFAVIGLTTRIDTINLLEKRVKSRFSGRVIWCSGIPDLKRWLTFTREILCVDVQSKNVAPDEWCHAWKQRTLDFLEDSTVVEMIKDTVGIVKDPKVLFRILASAVTRLSPTSPFLTPSHFSQAIGTQRSRPSYDSFDFPYPALCLIIAATHSRTAGHEIITFEMMFNAFRNQLRSSVAAPVQVNGGSIGMVRCSKAILESAFEHLIACRIFIPAGALSNTMAKEFVRYRMTLNWDEVKRIVDKTGQVTLKKWLNKAE